MGNFRIGWLALAVTLGVAIIDVAPAVAAEGTQSRATEFSAQERRARTRIEVYPRPAIRRECVDGYRVVSRPYWGGNVVMPYMRCWWVRG
jgi:hypothetical protein